MVRRWRLRSHSPGESAPPVRAVGPERLAEVARAKGIRDQRLLQAIASVPRAGFVPWRYGGRAYRDEPIPIGHDQVTTQPSLVAAMLEALALEGDERVLEVGTGHGFQTALLARLSTSGVAEQRRASSAFSFVSDSIVRQPVSLPLLRWT